MDDLNDIVWNLDSKSHTQTEPNKNQSNYKPISFTPPPSSKLPVCSGSNYNYNPISYPISNQRTPSSNYSNRTTNQSTSISRPATNDKKEDPFASLITFKPPVQKKSLQEQQLEREAAKNIGATFSVPDAWNGSINNKNAHLSPGSHQPELQNSLDPQNSPKVLSKATPTTKKEMKPLDPFDNLITSSEDQADDVFDIQHLLSQTKPSQTSAPLNEDFELLGLLGKPVEEVKRLQSVSPQEESLDSKLAQLLALGHDMEVSKIALSLTPDKDVSKAHGLITQHIKAENQTNSVHSVDSSDDDVGMTKEFQNKQYTKYSTVTKDSPKLFNRDHLFNQAEEVGNSVLSAASTLFFRSKKIFQNTWEEIQSRSSSGTPGSKPSQYEFGDRDSPSFGDYSDYLDENDTNSSQEFNIHPNFKFNFNLNPNPNPNPDRQKNFNALPAQIVERVDIPKDHIHASEDQLLQSEKFKLSGNEKFRVGQYGDANELYTQALDILPSNHSARIPILTNRSFALYLIGHFKLSLLDAEQAILIIGEDKFYMPAPNSSYNGKASLPLRDFYGKSLFRKALAHEGLENYNNAAQTYEILSSFSNYQIKALDGVRRCKQLCESPTSQIKSPSKPVISSQNQSGSIVSSEEIARNRAVQALRQKDVIQAAEDARRLEVSDKVDSKLLSWRKGREGNLRALLASLDTILWPDLQWVPVSLPNLIETNKVKRHYMRAISKLHPDKLSPSTSVEDRLLAGHVFAALNLAWDQFRADNAC